MKKLLYIFIASVICSCNSILEEAPNNFYDVNNFYQNDLQVEAAMNGISASFVTWELWIQPAFAVIMRENDDADNEGYNYTNNVRNYWGVYRPYKGYYLAIRRAQQLKQYLNKETLSEDMITVAEGYADFFIAYSYLELVTRFGEVPLRKKAYDVASADAGDLPRAPIKDIYEYIIENFLSASEKLPATYTSYDRGRPTSAAALGMLAKTYLFMAGKGPFGLNDSGYYAEAAKYAKQVIDMAQANGFPLLETNYADLFDQTTQDLSNEILFQIPLQSGVDNQGSELVRFYVPPGTGEGVVGRGGIGSVRMNQDLYNTFEAGDKRIEFGSMLFDTWSAWGKTAYHQDFLPTNAEYANPDNTEEDGNGIVEYVLKDTDGNITDDIIATSHYYCKKYIDSEAKDKSQNGANPIVLRYADVLLMYAEAQNEADGIPNTEAYTAVNQVRSRAGLADLATGLLQDDFRTAVWLERRHELYFEFQRRADLLRQGRFQEVMEVTGQTREEWQLRYPLSTEEINANSLINENNPGW